MTRLRATDVFKINGVPTHSYVDRSEAKLEKLLADAFEIDNAVISVSGPSKSGKTVLISQTVSADNLIPVSGAAIKVADDVWKHSLAWMDVSTPASISIASSVGGSIAGAGSGEIGLPLFAKGNIGAEASGHASKQTSTSSAVHSNLMEQVISEIAGSDFVIFIDDFHYIDKVVQSDVARQIKAIAERGVKVCTASVPHRSDDVVRSNPELRGRLAVVDSSYWSRAELEKIAVIGFSALNLEVPTAVISKFSSEAFGSPQLMQALCLSLCLEMDHREKTGVKATPDVGPDTMERVLLRSAMFSNYSTLVDTLHSGPKQRGTERKSFRFIDGSVGDVYRCVLLAIASDPASQQLRYEDILERVKKVCKEDAPVGSSVSEALRQMEKLASAVSNESSIIEWDDDTLNIVEPYFLFFIRCSDKLEALAQ